MPPIVKDSETAAATPISAAPATTVAKTRDESSAKPQPVALEIPVTVNGARAVEGSDKREPFSESTTTVLVFDRGAVVRSTSSFAPGQLIFLTNERTKKEVVCQVVKSKHGGGATGFVELQFTEPAIGFWGLRFPSDRLAPAGPRTVGPAVPVPPKVALPPRPAAPVATKPAAVAPPPPAPRPAAPIPPAPVKTIAPPPPPVPPEQEGIAAKLASHPLPLTDYAAAISALFDSPGVSEAQPAAKESPKVEAAPAHADPSTQQLKLQAARVQEQPGSLLFSETPVQPPPAPASANIARKEVSKPQIAEKPPQRAQTTPKPAAPAEIKPVAPTRNLAQPPLAAEQVKLPAWLAPLAHESESPTAEPVALPDLPALSDALPSSPSAAASALTVGVTESQQRQHSSSIGGQLHGESKAPASAVASHSKKGLFIGLAAALLLSAGVVWYLRQPANLISRLRASKPTQVAKLAPAAVPASAPPGVPAASTSKSVPVPASSPALHSEPSASGAATLSPASSSAAKNSKKPAVGQVRLATPVVTRAGASQASNESDPSIDINQSPNVDPLAGLATSHSKEPTAPIVIGGEIKPPRLLKSVAPSYPATARAQNISGDVKIDALIEANGAVSAVKVISGPVLLHQAALDAVKQWKYEPAKLNGQPTAIHLTVTVHFRNQ